MSLRLERLILLADEFNRQRYPGVELLCHKYEIQPRTFYEDLRFIREFLGLDIKFERGRGGYFNATPSKRLPVFELSQGEVFALTLGKEMLSQYVGTSFEPILRSAIEKIVTRLPDRVKVDVDDIRCAVKFQPGAVIPVEKRVLFELNKACEMCLPVEITYHSAHKDETTTRVIEPYLLMEYGGAWYVVAWCRLRKDMRYFALHRINDFHLIEDARFTPRKDLDVNTWVEKAFQMEHTGKEHHIKIHFAPQAARYIRERKWHDTQVLTEHDDKSCTLEFTTQSLDETKRWVLTYGSQAKVFAPQELRDLLQHEHESAAKQYQS